MKNKTIQMHKTALEAKLRQLTGVFPERDQLRIESFADPIDQIVSSADREMAVQRVEVQTALAHQVRSALARIEDGTYGLCERCEEPIPEKRLAAVPWAGLCAPCQARTESAGPYGPEPDIAEPVGRRTFSHAA